MLGRKIAEGLELPREALDDTPLVTVCGCESVIVENFKRILNFSDCRAAVAGKKICYRIMGEELRLEYIKRDIVKISGKISQICFERGSFDVY